MPSAIEFELEAILERYEYGIMPIESDLETVRNIFKAIRLLYEIQQER